MKKFIKTMLNPHYIIGLFFFIVSIVLAYSIPSLIIFNEQNGSTDQWYITYPYLVILIGILSNFAFDLSFKKQSDVYKALDSLIDIERQDLSGAGKESHDRTV